ncbi:MAG: hypothetical protein AAB401_04600 [Acidobacteriota bacterium]
MKSFEDLENRIAALDDDKIKGDCFEVFAEAYLATQRQHDAKKVWPLQATPLEVRWSRFDGHETLLAESSNRHEKIYKKSGT